MASRGRLSTGRQVVDERYDSYTDHGLSHTHVLPVQTPFRLQSVFVEQPACACSTEQLSARKNSRASVLRILVISIIVLG